MPRQVRRVSASELRELFNDGGYEEKVAADELIAVVEREHPARPQAGEPAGTLSQMIWYFDSSMNRVALVHQYLRPDGTIGGSGRPDPKRLLLDNEILFC